jgi:hypothetical protein
MPDARGWYSMAVTLIGYNIPGNKLIAFSLISAQPYSI